MSDWQSGFTSGVTATLIGFVCTILWDIYKYQRDKKGEESNAIHYVSQELSSNLDILAKNKALIEQELEIVKGRKDVINPLSTFKTGYWDLVKVEKPKPIVKTGNLFSE